MTRLRLLLTLLLAIALPVHGGAAAFVAVCTHPQHAPTMYAMPTLQSMAARHAVHARCPAFRMSARQ